MSEYEDNAPCWKHQNKGYKGGCPMCFEKNKEIDWDDDNGDWIHDPDMGDQ